MDGSEGSARAEDLLERQDVEDRLELLGAAALVERRRAALHWGLVALFVAMVPLGGGLWALSGLYPVLTLVALGRRGRARREEVRELEALMRRASRPR